MTDALRKAADALDIAAQAIADWGAYAGEYFQTKHNLIGDVNAARKAADVLRAAPAAPAPRLAVEWDYNDDKVLVRKHGEEWREAKPSELVSALLASGAASAPQDEREVFADMISDTRETFDADGQETPEVVRDVIEYVASWLTVYQDKRAGRASLAQAPDAWISVDERLPEKHTEVLVAFKGLSLPSTGQYTGHPRDTGGWSYPYENNAMVDEEKGPVVTHWMPLPITPHEAAMQVGKKEQS